MSQNIVLSILKVLFQINNGRQSRGETVVPFHKDNLEHYRLQLCDLKYSCEDIEDFCSWLETIDPQS
jgi:hypothetical protein